MNIGIRFRLSGALTAILGVISCTGSERVALNERVFAAETTQLDGGGCTIYDLGGGSTASTESGTVAGPLVVNQHADGDQVVVSVSEDNGTVVEKHYAESFFRAGTVDEFTVTPSSGGGALLLRYWGKLHPSGTAGCTPLDQSQP